MFRIILEGVSVQVYKTTRTRCSVIAAIFGLLIISGCGGGKDNFDERTKAELDGADVSDSIEPESSGSESNESEPVGSEVNDTSDASDANKSTPDLSETEATNSDTSDTNKTPIIDPPLPNVPRVATSDLPTGPLSPVDLDLQFDVLETAGMGSDDIPVSAVIPMPKGLLHGTAGLRVFDVTGVALPAQFDVLNRWWADDQSIRHLKVHFLTSLSAFAGTKDSGIASFRLRGGIEEAQPTIASRVEVFEDSNGYTIENGPLRLRLEKSGFNLIHQAWMDLDGNNVFTESEAMLQTGQTGHGAMLYGPSGETEEDRLRKDISFVIEEAGPIRAIIRASAPTRVEGTEDLDHGFAARIYVWAGRSAVKIDYQLQNSLLEGGKGGPMYFEGLDLRFPLALSGQVQVRSGLADTVRVNDLGNGISLGQEKHDMASITAGGNREEIITTTQTTAFIDVSNDQRGVAAMTRYWAEQWPNGLAVDQNKILRLELFPQWSATWAEEDNALSPSGLYWLEDMQHVYKEVQILFHGPNVSDETLKAEARAFTYHPIVRLPRLWHQSASASLDMGGLIPDPDPQSPIVEEERRIPTYSKTDLEANIPKRYRLGWDNFRVSDRKFGVAAGGGWPTGASAFIATGQAADWFTAEQWVLGELNVRPHWLAGYQHERDHTSIKWVNDNVFNPRHWRKLPRWEYLPGTKQDARARDASHSWYYHVEEGYSLSGNPWVRDWYEFIGEYRKNTLLNPSFAARASRGIGEPISHALAAYRVTGDLSVLDAVGSFIRSRLLTSTDWKIVKLGYAIDPYYGYRYSKGANGDITPWTGGQDAAFMAGYLLRSLIDYYEEAKDYDPQTAGDAFNAISAIITWNLKLANFANHHDVTVAPGTSAGNGLTLIDPQAWYYLQTGREDILNHLNQYIEAGIDPNPNDTVKAQRPIGGFRFKRNLWEGRWEARHSSWARTHRRVIQAPSAVTDLRAIRNRDKITLTWTAPNDAHRYHIVRCERPISEVYTQEHGLCNWWAGRAIGNQLETKPGAPQTLTFTPENTGNIYFSLFSFDNASNISAMSNVAAVVD